MDREKSWMSNPYLQGQATAVAERFARQGIKGAAQLRRVEAEMGSLHESALSVQNALQLPK
jgi:hypothetical protein